ncbi:MAG: alpha/beta hydrolase [Dysgonomonas sp.]
MKSVLLTVISILLSLSISAQILVSEENIVLKTPSGDILGTLKVPINKKAIPIALLIAGSGPTDRNGNQPNMQNNSLKMMGDALFYEGIASLSFDKLGIGESKGTMKNEADLRFEDYINDVCSWIDLLSEDKRFSDIIIIGHSEGSLIGMIASKDNKKVSKYISIAGAGETAGNILRKQLEKQLIGQPQSIKDLIFSYIGKLEKGETIENVPPTLNSLFRPSVQPYMISWLKYNPQNEISQLTIPSLILQGTTDIQVSTEQAEMLAKANPNAKKVIIENMNHVLKDCENTDSQSQITSTYNNPNAPINQKLVKDIVSFIKE